LLLALVAAPALAGGDTGAGSGGDLFADVTVSTNCNANPKSVTVTNDSDFTILVVSVVVAGDDFDMEDPMAGGQGEPIAEQESLAPGESATYSAPDGDAKNFVVVLAAIDAAAGAEAMQGKVTVAFVGCVEVDEAMQMPGMPQTGAGGMAGAGLPQLPLGHVATLSSLLGAGGLAALKRRN
jgi:hypothetical protein